MVGGFGSDRFVLCEPFVLDCGNVATVGYKAWRDEIDERRLIVRRGPHHPIACANHGRIQTLYKTCTGL